MAIGDDLFEYDERLVPRAHVTTFTRARLAMVALFAALLVFMVLWASASGAWSTTEYAKVDCYQNVEAVFKNTEPYRSEFSMDVTVNNDTRTIRGGQQDLWVFKQTGNTVTFYLKWTDGHPGIDTRTVTIKPEGPCVTTTTSVVVTTVPTTVVSTTIPSTTTTQQVTTTIPTTTTSQLVTTTIPTTTTTRPATTTSQVTTTTRPVTTTTKRVTTTVPETTTTAPTTTSTTAIETTTTTGQVESTTTTTSGATVTTAPTTSAGPVVPPAPGTPSLPVTGSDGTLFMWGCIILLAGIAILVIREAVKYFK